LIFKEVILESTFLTGQRKRCLLLIFELIANNASKARLIAVWKALFALKLAFFWKIS